MSPALIQADNRRTTARVALAIFVAFLTAFVLLSGGPIGAISFAQQQTTSPAGAPCNGAQIEWVNPSGDATGPGSEMSNKPENAGQAGATTTDGYHLVAWVSGSPETPKVEFKYKEGTNPEVPITPASGATRIGSTDTWEFYWNLNGVPEGTVGPMGPSTISMVATLYAGSSATECDKDTENAYVNNASPSGTPNPQNEAQAETVEITYPTNAGTWGMFNRAGQIEVRFSQPETTYLIASYTVTPVGSEPVWNKCGTETASNATSGGIKCTLANADHKPEQVTGVAVMANDTPSSSPQPADQLNDSGDAHRVFGYVQTPLGVTIAAFTNQVAANGSGDFPCSPIITAKITDQNGREVSGANVDVHAAGPTDDLYFDDDNASSNEVSSSQPPNTGGHTSESGVDCESSTVPPPFTADVQGDHDQGGNDIKHIESTSGTSEDGEFSFRLNNRSKTTGTTDVLVFADLDDNDQFCSGQEPSTTTAIGWGTAPAPGSAPAGPSACPSGSATTSPTTTSPSPTPTQSSASPTPTNTTSSPPPNQCSDGVDNDGDGAVDGNDQGCADGDGDESTGDAPPAQAFPTTVSGRYDDGQNRHEGRVNAGPKRCEKGRKVVVKKVRVGRDKVVGSDTSNRAGAWSVTDRGADGTYYSVAKKKTFTKADGTVVTCRSDRSRRYKA